MSDQHVVEWIAVVEWETGCNLGVAEGYGEVCVTSSPYQFDEVIGHLQFAGYSFDTDFPNACGTHEDIDCGIVNQSQGGSSQLSSVLYSPYRNMAVQNQ